MASGKIEKASAGLILAQGTVTLPDGSSTQTKTTIDCSSQLPSGTYRMIAFTLGNYPLPYIQSNNMLTYIEMSNSQYHTITVVNKTSAWANYRYLALWAKEE